jgi:hypothetical protein
VSEQPSKLSDVREMPKDFSGLISWHNQLRMVVEDVECLLACDPYLPNKTEIGMKLRNWFRRLNDKIDALEALRGEQLARELAAQQEIERLDKIREDVECLLAPDPCLPHKTELGLRVQDRLGHMERQLATAQEEIERLQKANVFLKEELKQKAKFNPDWDVLQATRESLREAWAEIAELRKDKERLDAGDDLHASWYFDNKRYEGTLRECLDQHIESEGGSCKM